MDYLNDYLERSGQDDQKNVGGAKAFNKALPHRNVGSFLFGRRLVPVIVAVDTATVTYV